MPEYIDESVSVNLLSNHLSGASLPTSFYWRGRRYHVNTLGLHHTTHVGRTLVHVFSVTDGANFFKLQLDTETLNWKLLEIDTSN